jgi:hypothetical protein
MWFAISFIVIPLWDFGVQVGALPTPLVGGGSDLMRVMALPKEQFRTSAPPRPHASMSDTEFNSRLVQLPSRALFLPAHTAYHQNTPASSVPLTTLVSSEYPPIRSLFRDPKGRHILAVPYPFQTTLSPFRGPSCLHTHIPAHPTWQFIPKVDTLMLVDLHTTHLPIGHNGISIGSLDVTRSGKGHALHSISSCLGSTREARGA